MKVLPFWILVFANTGISQPLITRLAIDEISGKLLIHGQFGDVSNQIKVGDTVLNAESISDSLIIVPIPLAGNGSDGEVTVHDEFGSATRTLTAWWIVFEHYYGMFAGTPRNEETKLTARLHFRADIESGFKDRNYASIRVICSRGSTAYLSHWEDVYYVRKSGEGDQPWRVPSTAYKNGFEAQGYIGIESRSLSLTVTARTLLHGSDHESRGITREATLSFDSTFAILEGSKDYRFNPMQKSTDIADWQQDSAASKPAINFAVVAQESDRLSNIYPNPSTTVVCLPGPESSPNWIATDSKGGSYRLRQIERGTADICLDVSGLAAGIYFLSTQSSDRSVGRFIKK